MKTLKKIYSGFMAGCLLACFQCYGQSSISGQVQESHGKPLAYANVLLLNAEDSSLVKGMVSSEEGLYSLDQVKPGQYLLTASMVGYKQSYSPVFTLLQQQGSKPMTALTLAEDVQQLGEVVVEAQKPLYEQQIDKLVVNVQSSITSAGATALDVLERSPGVAVNRQNNALSLVGKEGVVVMINGKPSRLPMEAVLQMLSGMNASNIEKIEIITTPPSSFDAEGNAGVINIILKKNSEYGTNGSYSLTLGYGWYEKPAASFNINHRRQKLNLFSDYSFSLNHSYQSMSNKRQVNHQNGMVQINSLSRRDPLVINHTGHLGFDYNISPGTSLSGLLSGFSNKFDINEKTISQVVQYGQLITSINGKHQEINHWRHLMGNLSFQHALSNNQEINLDVDYLYYHDNNPHQYTYTYSDGGDDEVAEDLRIEKLTPIKLWVGKGDYTNNLGEQTKLEAGLKATVSRLTNDVLVEDLMEGDWQTNSEFSQNMEMLEDIGAAYLNFNHQLNEKTKLQTGLRGEYTRTDLSTPDQPRLIQRRYVNLFPSLFLARDLTKGSSIQISYGRRITRPTYNNLAPFVYFIDPYTFFSGNISLLPAITDAMQAIYRFEESYLLTLGLSHDKNPIIPWQVHIDPETNKQYARAENLKSANTYSLTFTFPVKITSWWEIQNNIMGIWQINRAVYEDKHVQVKAGYGRLNMTHSFTLPGDFSAELSGFYQTRTPFGISYIRAMGSINVGIQKKLNNDKGTLRLSVDDLFWTNQFRFISDQPALNLNQSFVGAFSEPRIVRFTFSRNFGNKNIKSTNRSTGSEEERKRVSGS